MKILVFGNPLVEKDSIALKIIPELRKEFPEIEFKEMDPTEDLAAEGKNLFILDAIEGIDKVKLIELEDFDKIETKKVFSMHDFDLGYNLKLLKKVGKIDYVRIIGIPLNMSEQEAFNQVQLILRKCVAQFMQGS